MPNNTQSIHNRHMQNFLEISLPYHCCSIHSMRTGFPCPRKKRWERILESQKIGGEFRICSMQRRFNHETVSWPSHRQTPDVGTVRTCERNRAEDEQRSSGGAAGVKARRHLIPKQGASTWLQNSHSFGTSCLFLLLSLKAKPRREIIHSNHGDCDHITLQINNLTPKKKNGVTNWKRKQTKRINDLRPSMDPLPPSSSCFMPRLPWTVAFTIPGGRRMQVAGSEETQGVRVQGLSLGLSSIDHITWTSSYPQAITSPCRSFTLSSSSVFVHIKRC